MNITFIGLGKMGSAMVERLLAADYEVTVFNRTLEKAAPLVELGAQVCDSIAEAVSKADVVLSALSDDKAVIAITESILPVLKPGAIHIGLATILPDTAVLLQTLHQKVSTSYISATVLGVPEVARQGKLMSFCAGDRAALEVALPILATFSKEVISLGEQIKAPNLIKICMNYSLITALELISELYVFAEKSGIDKEIVRQGLHQIYGHPAFKRYVDKIADREFDQVNFSMKGGAKDVDIFQQAFKQVGVEPKLGNILADRFQQALSLGLEQKDWSGIYEVVRAEAAG